MVKQFPDFKICNLDLLYILNFVGDTLMEEKCLRDAASDRVAWRKMRWSRPRRSYTLIFFYKHTVYKHN